MTRKYLKHFQNFKFYCIEVNVLFMEKNLKPHFNNASSYTSVRAGTKTVPQDFAPVSDVSLK